MAYRNPEMDFRVASYDYLSRGQILQLNGGDEELMWKQFEAILANLVSHGQEMKWLGSKTATAENERVISLMKKVGLRTDVFIGVSAPGTVTTGFSISTCSEFSQNVMRSPSTVLPFLPPW